MGNERIGPEIIDAENWIAFPEQRLWASVVLLLIDDYRTLLERMSLMAAPIHRDSLYQLEVIRYQANTEWFKHICDYINLSSHLVNRQLDAFEFNIGLNKLVFAPDVRRKHNSHTQEGRRERNYLHLV